MKKFIVSMISVVTLLSVFIGCGVKTDENPQKQAQQESPKQELTVSHSKGTVTIPSEIKKAAVFDFGILDIIDSLEVEVELAIPTSNIPTYLAGYAKTATNAGNIKEPDMEAIYTFAPDVIFISARQETYYDELNKIAPTIYVDLKADTYMEDLAHNVELVAKTFHKEDTAKTKLDAIQKHVEEVKTKAEALDKKALIILTNDGNISAYGKGSRFGMIHDVLGIKTADDAIEVSTHGQEASYEYISKVNPDILFVVDRTTVVGGSKEATATLDNALIHATNAYQNNKIIMLDANIWYLAGGGLTSVEKMITEVEKALA